MYNFRQMTYTTLKRIQAQKKNAVENKKIFRGLSKLFFSFLDLCCIGLTYYHNPFIPIVIP